MESNAGVGDTQPDTPTLAIEGALLTPSYELGQVIGKGGMGEIVMAHDPKIGREVAIKRMSTAAPSPLLVHRFLREAKIQARLGHPAIVPVYEVGYDELERPYFTMKRLTGVTLLERLTGSGMSRRHLLRGFVDVCLALEYAHEQGVVHRDLKPANIMLGDYGEVYVLDWGVARVIERGTALTPALGSPSFVPEPHTQAGALLGTPGYIAPEQVRGEEVGPAADVYSLGCILFEILAGEPLHPRGPNAIPSTLSSPPTRPSRRCAVPMIAPELDATCADALAEDPSQRPTARELADRVQRYLDGDRDLENRRAHAAQHLERERALLPDLEQRAEAIREAGRAVALDPELEAASELVMKLMLEPPSRLPSSLRRQLDDEERSSTRQAARFGAIGLTCSFLVLPLLLWVGVTSWPLLAMIYGLYAALAFDAYRQAATGRTHRVLPLVLGTALLVLQSRVVGPLVLAPTVICVLMISFACQPQRLARSWTVLVFALGSFIVPIVLELLGVFGHTTTIEHGQLVVSSGLMRLDGPRAYVAIAAMNVFLLTCAFVFIRTITSNRRTARRQLEVQAWRLRQLLPRDH